MSDTIDPQEVPVTDGLPTGQIEPNNEPAPTPTPEEISQQLAQAEQRNRELEKRLRRQGNEIAQMRQQSPATTPASPNSDPEAWFSDPGGSTQKAMEAALSKFRQEQEDRIRADRYLDEYAEEHGIPRRRLQQQMDRLRDVTSSNDPEALLDMLRLIDTAENASSVISQTATAVRSSTERNARAVTATPGAAPQVSPQKAVKDMTLEEHRAFLVSQLGEVQEE